MINLATVTGALKNFYIHPLREDINLKADAFASRIMQTSTHISGYNKIIRAAQIGANGGAGAGTETGALPSAGENLYRQFESDTKNLYGTLEISDKILRSATGQNAGSFVNALQQDMDTLLKTLKWNMARQIYGDGSGHLASVKAASSTAVMTVAEGDSTQFLLPGLKVDQYAVGSTAASAAKNSGLRILDVDHLSGAFTLSSAVSADEGDYFVVQGSHFRELTGLGKIFEPIEGSSQTLYGLNRAENSWLRPYRKEGFGSLSEAGLQEVLNALEDSYNVEINHINCGNAAYGHYLSMLTERRTINDVTTLEGGHRALLFNGIPLTRNKFMPQDAIDMYDTSLFTIDQIADWEWIEGESHQILHQVPGYPKYQATVAKYCDLMCVLPGGIARLTGITA